MEGSRLRILQLLQKNHSYTVDGLSNALGLAPATIRRHLDILQRDRLVDFREVRKRTGRPEYSFYLTEAGHESLPKEYDQLLGMMVEEISYLEAEHTRAKNGQQILDLVFERMSDRVADGYSEELDGKGMSSRLDTLTRHLEEANFFPDVEVADGRILIRLQNCPFRSVALQNKSVCGFDLNLIGSLLDADVERQECIHDGDNSCMYTATAVASAGADPA